MSAQHPTLHSDDPGRALSIFVSTLTFESVPELVIRRTEDLLLDWLGSALAGRDARPTRVFARFAATMGPNEGPSELVTSDRGTSPFYAAFVNGAASHVVEQDDLHNRSVLHPGTVVFPAVLAAAQHIGASGRELLTAAIAGYECGTRVGEFLGRSHYRVFHTTGTAGTLAAAAGVARLLRLTPDQTQHALGSAGTMAAGLWEFLRDAADSKQLHTGRAAAEGLAAAYFAKDGLTGARRIFDGAQGMAAGMSSDAEATRLDDGLGQRWATAETSFKLHASCRHTHPAADALLAVMREHSLAADDIARVRAHVHQAAIDVLGAVVDPRTVHQSKFSMPFVLATIALRGHAGLADFTDAALADEKVRAFGSRVTMALDPDVDGAYPARWIGKVTVNTRDARVLTAQVDEPKGDPGNTLSRPELEQKFRHLAGMGGIDAAAASTLIERVWRLAGAPVVRPLLR